ncbi:hypothetical protein QJQ45_024020, partial [Haematococcus lacustris]
VVEGMKWVFRQHYHQERGVAVFLGAGNFSQGGWKAGAVREGFRKVVEQPSRPSTFDRPDGLVIMDDFRTSRVSSSVHARQPCELHLPNDRPRPADWVPPAGQVDQRLVRPAWSLRHAKDEPPAPAQSPPGPVPRPQAPPWGRRLDRDTNGCLNFQRIGESMQPPLELCSWKDREALPPVGKEYQQRYMRVIDRLPKPPQAPRSSQEATPAAASEPGPSTPPPAKLSKRIGESRWRPLELCWWSDQGALPAKGKEYPGLGYKRLRDKPPLAQKQQHAGAHSYLVAGWPCHIALARTGTPGPAAASTALPAMASLASQGLRGLAVDGRGPSRSPHLTSRSLCCGAGTAMMELKPSLLPVMPSSTVLEQALHPALHRLAPPPSKRSVDELMATSPAFVEQSEPTPVPDNSLTLEQRAVGCMLSAMCGNALGAPVANDRHWQVMRMFPRGLTEFWGVDFSAIKPVKRGHFTGDYQMLVATARSLARAQGRFPSVEEQAVELAVSCDPAGRRYSPYAEVLLDGLRGGQPIVRGLPHLAQSFLAQSQAQLASTATDRQERQPWGPADNGAAARVAPVALACAARGASLAELEAAVNAMCEVTHPHPLGRDGAWVVAAALHWLLAHHPGCRVAASQQLRQPVLSRSRQGTRQHHANGNVNSLGNADVLLPKPAASEQPDHSTPEALLEFLESVARTEDMRGKLQLLRSNLLQVSPVTSWPTFYASRDWQRLVQVVSRLTYHDYATSGTEAAAVALWALVTHWQLPRQAICVAATWGGSAPVTTQIVGALAGAAHGSMWIPDSWMQGVENGPDPSSLSTRDSLTQPFGQAEGLQGSGLGVAAQGVAAQGLTAQDASQEASQGQQEVEQGMRPGTMAEGSEAFPLPGATALQGIRDEPVRGLMWCPVVDPRKPPQAPRSSQAATLAAASEPRPSTPPPAKRTKAEQAAEPNKGKGKAQGKAAKAKPAPQPGRWLDRDCNAALNMQRVGQSRWRPLELCYWKDQGALPAKGKEYPGLGYKRLQDKPPSAQNQQPAGAQ